MENLESLLQNLGVGVRPMDDPFFENSYKSCKVFERRGVTVEDEEELCHEIMTEFNCNACEETFQNLLDYELHYHNSHHFVCSQCKKWRPTARLLEIHVQEMHDSFFQVLAEKKPMYQCFVSECDMKFKDSIERRDHCRSVHEFPKNYRFDEVKHEKIKTISNEEMQVDVNEDQTIKNKNPKIYLGKNVKQKTFTRQNFNLKPEADKSNINSPNVEKKMSPVTMFIPRQVQKSYAKSLTKNQQMERNVLETESIMELGESLPST